MAKAFEAGCPQAAHVGWLDVPDIERPDIAEAQARKEDDAAQALGLKVWRVTVRGASDLDGAFTALERHPVQALVVPNTSLLNPLADRIASLAVKHRLPSVGSPIFARAGGLLAEGPDGADLYRRAAGYVDRILKGAAPGSLPMEGPAKFEMIVNLKSARALGLTIPPSLLARADQVIE
jgi:putative ABC transport system substrate-binding protein